MTSWASVPRTRAPRADLPPFPCTPAGVRSTALAVTGALLSASAATLVLPLVTAAPASAQQPVPAEMQAPTQTVATQGRTVTFDYSADVAPNDVYDTRRAEAPQPLFRALGHRVDVQADYAGPAAHLSLLARLSSTTGWSSSVPLADEVEVDGRGRVRATVDLRRLEDRAALVALQTKMPFEGMTVELVAAVRDDAGTWTPSVALSLTPQQLRLTGEPSTLVVRQEASAAPGSATPAAPTPQSRLDDLLGWRPGGLLTSAVLTLALAGGMVVVRRRADEDDASRARRRLGRLLLDVVPADLTGLRLVEVATPDALARLAERYGLLVMHWTDAFGEVFVVQDETTAYRWSTGERPALPVPTRTVAMSDPHQATQDQAAGDQAAQDQAAQDQAAQDQAARAQAEREDAERRAAERVRRDAERRQHAEAAESARLEAERAHAARLEAEQLERRRQDEADRAARAWQAIEQAYAEEAAAEVEPRPHTAPAVPTPPAVVPTPAVASTTPVVPAPRAAADDSQLADGPPREAGTPRPGRSIFEVG